MNTGYILVMQDIQAGCTGRSYRHDIRKVIQARYTAGKVIQAQYTGNLNMKVTEVIQT